MGAGPEATPPESAEVCGGVGSGAGGPEAAPASEATPKAGRNSAAVPAASIFPSLSAECVAHGGGSSGCWPAPDSSPRAGAWVCCWGVSCRVGSCRVGSCRVGSCRVGGLEATPGGKSGIRVNSTGAGKEPAEWAMIASSAIEGWKPPAMKEAGGFFSGKD